MSLTRRSALRAVRTLIHLFFRRINVTGVDNVPTSGGGILIAWHPNGLVDPALIMSELPRTVVFGARHGLFKWPLVGQILRALSTVPIYRASDLKDSDDNARREANQKSLDALAEAVCGGGFAALFPEGISHDDPFVQDLKTGAARLYYRAKQLSPPGFAPPAIVPVGLHYNNKTAFRSNALVEFFPPIALRPELSAPIAEGDSEELLARSKKLTAEFETILQEVTHATESWELNHLMHRVRTLVRAERASRAGAKLEQPDMVERALGMARVWKGYYARQETHPEETQQLLEHVSGYDAAIRKLNLEDDDLDRSRGIGSKWLPLLIVLQAAVVFLLLPPFLLLGYLINAIPYFLVRAAAEAGAKKYKDTASIKLIAGAVLYPATWLAAALLVGFGQIELHENFGVPRAPWAAGVTTFLIGAIGSALALIYAELVRETWNTIKIRVKRQWRASQVKRLRKQRGELCDAIEQFSSGLDLPGEVLDDGRVSHSAEFKITSEDLP